MLNENGIPMDQPFRPPHKRLAEGCGLLVLALALCGGCLLPGRSRPLQFTITSAGLDVLEILYLPGPQHPVFPAPIRLTLFGSGSATIREGFSPRVMDSFSTDIAHPAWNDYRENQFHTDMQTMTAIFQRFIDKGLIYPIRRQPRPPQPQAFPMVRVVGKIDGNPVHRLVFEPELVALIESLILSGQ